MPRKNKRRERMRNEEARFWEERERAEEEDSDGRSRQVADTNGKKKRRKQRGK